MFFLFLVNVFCEIFVFDQPNKTLKIMLTLAPENINTGFFKPEGSGNLGFRVNIVSKDERKTLYTNYSLARDTETHFSFNNTEAEDVDMLITPFKIDQNKPVETCEIYMKFESTPDTFNAKISKEVQYKPAISALNGILAKLNQITAATKAVHNESASLKNEQKRLMDFVVFLATASVIGYAAFNVFQLYLMKSYLNEKKYL